MSKPLIYTITVLLLALSLAGCGVAPETLGISQQQWHNYSSQQRQQILRDSKKISHKTMVKQTKSESRLLQINISDGQAMMPPFVTRQSYIPISFKLAAGSCINVAVDSINSLATTSLTVCFHKGVLLLDPSRYELGKQDGSIRLHYLPLWHRGFTYKNISSSGYVSLQNVNIKVKELESKRHE